MVCNLEIACAKYCYEGPSDENPWSQAGYGGDNPDYSDQISGLEDQNRPHGYHQPCVKNSGKTTSFNPEEGADTGLSAALPVATEAADVEPGTNENTPLAWTGFSDGVFNGLNVGDSATAGGTTQETFDTQVKRSVPRQQRQRGARRMLG